MARNADRFLINPAAANWLPSISASNIAESKRLLVELSIELGLASPKGVFDRRQLMAALKERQCELTNARVGQLLQELTEEGAFERFRMPEEAITVYRMAADLSRFLVTSAKLRSERNQQAKPNSNEIRQEVAHQRQALMVSNAIEFLGESPTVYYGERLMNGILDAAVRTGRNDKRKVIVTRYPLPVATSSGFTKEWIGIQAVCRSNAESQVIELPDLAVVYALNSLFVEHIERKYGSDPDPARVRNLFVFDIIDLCEELGYDPKARDLVAARLRRLRDTVFKIDVTDAPEFRAVFGYEGRSLVEFQYLTEFEIATETVVEDLVNHGETDALAALKRDPLYHGEASNSTPDLFSSDADEFIDISRMQVVRRKPRFYFVKFNERHFWALIEQARHHRFLVHEGLKQERLGIVQRFYSWAKAYIGVRPRYPKPEAVQFLLDEFHTVCLPSSDYRTFGPDIEKMAQKFLLPGTQWNPDGNNVALIYGYYLEIDFREEQINEFRQRNYRGMRRRGRQRQCPLLTIYRDTEDPLIGDNSAHNQALRQQKLVAWNRAGQSGRA
jgi:hypothetical protein